MNTSCSLPPSGQPWPFIRSLIHRAEVSSTSGLAREFVGEGSLLLPLLIRADLQTSGRGQGRKTWWSDSGSLTFTLIINPLSHGLSPSHESRLALATAVAIVESLASYLPPTLPLNIRWPNDVQANGLKLAGILPERVDTPSGPRLLIGIGLNITTNLSLAPPEVRRMAVSIAELADTREKSLDFDALLALILANLEKTLLRLAVEDPALAARWAELDALRNQPIEVKMGPRILSGIGVGIDPQGALLLATRSETLQIFGGQVLRHP